jgi:serine phosphatase RsbU (regulator of sigma subunit)
MKPFATPGPMRVWERRGRDGRWPGWAVFVVASGLEVGALALLGLNTSHHDIVGVTGAVAVLIAVVAAVASGPWVGLGVAVVGGAAFWAFISDMGDTAPLSATLVSVVVWSGSATISGVVADRLREQGRARRAAQGEAAVLHAQLEAGLLPRLRPTVGPLSVLWRYLPSERRLGVSGDFYDVAMTPDGTAALVIGDVVGHGAHAAALGATLRAGWYTLVSAGAPIERVVTTLAESLAREKPEPDTYVTVLLAWIAADQRHATLVRLGHPPPLLLSGRAVTELQTAGGLPLGADDDAGWQAVTVELPPQWSLLLYTDGLVEGREAPGSARRYGLQRLLSRLAEGAPHLDGGRLDEILNEVTAANGGRLPDDVAVVVVSPCAQP